jgi:Reverse transcriptase (RNA-dependent DNA polymerase)
VWRGEGWIEDRIERIIVPIVKKEEEKRVEDYRGVTLTSTLYNVYASVLADRLREDVEGSELVPQNQTGFRKAMGTIDNIYVLNYLINKQINKKEDKMVAFFIDLKAAFHSVDRGKLIEAMRERKVRGTLIAKCEDMLREIRNRIKIGEERGENFWTGGG